MIHVVDLRDRWEHHPKYRKGRKGKPGGRMFSIRQSASKRRKDQRYDLPVDERPVNKIILHQWGTPVGISTKAKQAIAAGTLTEHDALAARAIEAPYHISVGLTRTGEGVVVLAWPFWLHMHHAGAENAESIGIGIMGRFQGIGDLWSVGRPALADALSGAIRLAVATAVDHIDPESWNRPLLRTHSQTTDKPADPGEFAIAHVVAPLVRAGVIRVEPDFHRPPGEPWPKEWRRHMPNVG